MTGQLELETSLTHTPLARAFDRTLAGGRTKTAIPWRSFDRTRYPAVALDLAASAHAKLATGEYGAVPLFSRITAGLAECGAPFDLIAAAARVPSDEIRHAEQAVRMMRLLSSSHRVPPVDIQMIERRWARKPTWRLLDRVVIESAVIGETLACGLLAACEDIAEDPTLRAGFASLVADEIHHARFGWYYLAYRTERWSKADRQHAADRAAAMLVNLESWFAIGRDAPRGARAAARALGLLDTATQRATLKDVVESEIVPALDAIGLSASHAWRARRRAT
ncbi:MAG: hypothetical protein JST00_08930 [Deltaproteobacteria bacterium]|nr:hypothetical protein [Deltaproteobacteria bacterium]